MNTKAGAKQRLQDVENRLLELSHRIHATPELGFEEEHASAWVAEMLDANGFTVERAICGLPAAFAAHAGRTFAYRHLRGVRQSAVHGTRLRTQRRGAGDRRDKRC